MRIEHVALSVADPAASAAWYVEHIGCTLARAGSEEPFAHFLLVPGGGVMLELFRSPNAPVPDWPSVNPFQGHVAFHVDDIDATCHRLLAAGASSEGAPGTSPDGDRYAMLRDPWGVPLQFVSRADPML
jgi:catechol 2,3-dioxygenase-like lactoylglutathione lyase family enzyme